MALALFDLDHTLLVGDSDHSWGEFLVQQRVIQDPAYLDRSHRYFEEYQAGRLDIHEFLEFQLRPLVGKEHGELAKLREAYIADRILPLVTPEARSLVDHHRGRGDTLAIVTATNDFITRPIAGLFGIEHLIATELERVNGAFTGRIVGEPCFREGKVIRLQAWLAESGHDLEGSWFYSDSRNDLPLLERVDHPVAVNPDPFLEQEARRRNWPIRRFS